MNDLTRRAIEIANSQEGVREEHENRGPQVEAYLRSTHLGPGFPWCAAYVYWCISTAAAELRAPTPFPLTAYCPDIHNWARAHDVLGETPGVGDVFLLYGAAEARHTGFVTSVDGARFGTIEGNTNLDGSAEGIGVFKRARMNGNEFKFVHWESMATDTGDLTFQLVANGTPLLDMPVRGGRALCPIRKFGEALGFQVEWNQEKQAPLFNGKEIDTQVILIDNTAYAPVRDLATAAGLKLAVDADGRKVNVTK